MPIENKLNLPQPFVDAATSDYKYTPKRYSVTSLLKGNREAILQRRYADQIVTDVADSVWLIFGKAVHSILENSQGTETQIKEKKLELEMPNGYTLSGIFDLFDTATGVVTDYKTASVWKVIFDDWDDYRKQLLAYCYMLRRSGYDARTGEIVALLKDHSKTKAKHDSSYPQFPVIVKRFDFTAKEIDAMGEWLEWKFRTIEQDEQCADDMLPVCTAAERWATGQKWAVMKEGRKSAVKLFDNEEAAIDYLDSLDSKHYIEHRPGEDKKCAEYCSVSQFCSYWKDKKGFE